MVAARNVIAISTLPPLIDDPREPRAQEGEEDRHNEVHVRLAAVRPSL